MTRQKAEELHEEALATVRRGLKTTTRADLRRVLQKSAEKALGSDSDKIEPAGGAA